MAQTVYSTTPATATEGAVDVELRGVIKRFDDEPAVQGLDLRIYQGEFFSILGPSGCGKTTTLRLIAGFETPTEGLVMIQGVDMGRIPAHRRPVNTVFQSYALFDHMTVRDNIAFGLKIKRLPSSQVRERVLDALRLVRMESLADRMPNQLSGGQKQRVALARALVNRPAVMLLDEPLGALDLKLRKQMQVELSTLHRQLGITFIMVTHDQEEALSLSDRIAVMNAGRIDQIGTPSDIYDRPTTPFVADFIGDTNLLKGHLAGGDSTVMRVITPSGLKVLVQRPPEISPEPHPVVVSVRPEKIRLSADFPTADNCYHGQISHVMYLGTHVHCGVRLSSGETLTVLLANRGQTLPDLDTPIYAYWAAEDARLLSAESTLPDVLEDRASGSSLDR
ncbi:spermidine/putrescine ABC transporter ATP-binding protein [Leptolyngbya sp. BL0902]|uniref:ABC transporter ATP-binding protein n=1 Tax=Leptolyngbya sp. BL0902 TaxID=1115757 RepID=UPI0018E80EA2|nr:ABC transporter ATP-binding protein [Leptolyngbya sp. BL0902]QQE64686.1 spermidine/putrescine ABC transporter ATP-binding protein [Leptolyngbya sp. BL0902]